MIGLNSSPAAPQGGASSTPEGVKEFPRNSDGKASPPCGGDSGMTMLFFSLEVAPVSEGDSFTPREWSFGAVPPQERRHEEERVLPCRLRRGGTRGFGFLWGLLRCRYEC